MRPFRPYYFFFILLLAFALSNLFSQEPIVIQGIKVEGIDFKPWPVIFVTVNRGGTQEATLEITNNRATPLKIGKIVNPSEQLTARVETLEEGKRFNLVVTLKGEGPAGKKQQFLELKTNFEDTPVFRIPVNTYVKEKVRTFPDSVFMGRFPLSEIKGNSDLAKRRAQILMVYRDGIPKFEITVTSDVPWIKISSERGPTGDRWENTIWIDPDLAQPGKIDGNITIKTNDPDFPQLTVPVWGDIQAR
jgi:hypothetical protein